ncbi:MAG: 1-acyl-sn-glycerol-3-phosphate acyltransferase [Desulfarculales bacterium]|nr:1-acyl-sn-glycerol-3-phosphate acyltransferase [Desulfarculales bacterium]
MIIRIIWSIWAIPWVLLITALFSSIVIMCGLLGMGDKKLQPLAALWARMLLLGTGCAVKISGREKLTPGQPYVFACNHSSALDIPVLFRALPSNFRWIAKKELFRIPLFGQSLRAAGYVPMDRSNRRASMQSLADASARIKAGASVVIFPEGTRSRDGRLGEFKSGGFLLALTARQPVVPALILGANKILPPKLVFIRPGRIEVRIGRPIPLDDMNLKQRDRLAGQVREEIIKLHN